ncbi:MAG TPA: hypothetical protein ENJ18_07670 [Nannocystis exedens]|nr:hypothetical protein [Nannocystis exedens]
MGLHWPEAVGERLRLTWTGEADPQEVLGAAARAYFELTGVRAVAAAEGIGPVLYRHRGEVPATLGDLVELSVEITAIRRRCACMQIAWRAAECSGLVRWIWCWRASTRGSAPIPAAARIGVVALDGPFEPRSGEGQGGP